MLSCGFGEGYSLGHQDNQTLCEFKAVSALASLRVEKISCGIAHSGCIAEGRGFVWGVALPNREQIRVPTQIKVQDD